MAHKEVLRLEGVSKSFPGVKALDSVSFTLRKGEVHCLLGENGAGKSTMLKIMNGIYIADEGNVFIDEHKIEGLDVNKARSCGVAHIHQELMLVPELTILENIFLGNEITGPGGKMMWKEMSVKTTEILKELGLDLSPKIKVVHLSTAQQQMVEIAKTLLLDKKIILLDEPTDSLSRQNTEDLFKIIHKLKVKGVSMVYISHRLEEFQHIADRVTVLRDGKTVGTYEFDEITLDELVVKMVGRDLVKSEPYPFNPGEPVLAAHRLTREPAVNDVSFSLRKGEILGFAGLIGAGRTELMRLLFGADQIQSGCISLKGKTTVIHSPEDAVRLGIGLLTEDRKHQGLVLGMSITENLSLANLTKFIRFGRIDTRAEKKGATKKVAELTIDPPHIHTAVQLLSGGNQQKVVIGKWLNTECDVLIFDEPTRGIDVGARAEIYQLMHNLIEQGKSIIIVSSDLPEVLAMSTRIIVMAEGRITGELSQEEATEEKLMALMLGGNYNVA